MSGTPLVLAIAAASLAATERPCLRLDGDARLVAEVSGLLDDRLASVACVNLSATLVETADGIDLRVEDTTGRHLACSLPGPEDAAAILESWARGAPALWPAVVVQDRLQRESSRPAARVAILATASSGSSAVRPGLRFVAEGAGAVAPFAALSAVAAPEVTEGLLAPAHQVEARLAAGAGLRGRRGLLEWFVGASLGVGFLTTQRSGGDRRGCDGSFCRVAVVPDGASTTSVGPRLELDLHLDAGRGPVRPRLLAFGSWSPTARRKPWTPPYAADAAGSGALALPAEPLLELGIGVGIAWGPP